MKKLKILSLAALAAMALTAFGASAASATTLEVNGVTKNQAIAISASLAVFTSTIISRTDGSLANTCTTSGITPAFTSTYTGVAVTAPAGFMSFGNCERPVSVHSPGGLEILWTSGTNGRLVAESTQITVGSPFGTVNCTTGSWTTIGTLTGVSLGNAVMDINAVVNCGILLPSATWKGTYTVTSPTALGVSA